MNVVFMGPPGAGKGTHAELTCQRWQIAHIATGDLLRHSVRAGTALGKKAKSIMEQGQLVPDEVVIKMIEERLQQADAKQGFVLDGFPRTVQQAEALEVLLKAIGIKLDFVVDFKVSQDVVVRRLSGRRTCPKCYANYHLTNIPPKQAGKCDRCGATLVQRKDDAPETVLERLRVYEKQTAPLVEFYQTRGLRREVDGDLGIDALQAALGKFF